MSAAIQFIAELAGLLAGGALVLPEFIAAIMGTRAKRKAKLALAQSALRQEAIDTFRTLRAVEKQIIASRENPKVTPPSPDLEMEFFIQQEILSRLIRQIEGEILSSKMQPSEKRLVKRGLEQESREGKERFMADILSLA